MRKVNYTKSSTLSPLVHRQRKRRLSRRLRDAVAASSLRNSANIRRKNFTDCYNDNISSDEEISPLRSSFSEITTSSEEGFDARREKSVPCSRNNIINLDNTKSIQSILNLDHIDTNVKLDLSSSNKNNLFLETDFGVDFFRPKSAPIDDNLSYSDSVKNILTNFNKASSLNLLNSNSSKHETSSNNSICDEDNVNIFIFKASKGGARYRRCRKHQQKLKNMFNNCQKEKFIILKLNQEDRINNSIASNLTNKSLLQKIENTTIDLHLINSSRSCGIEQLQIQFNGLKTLEKLEQELQDV